MPYCRAVSIPGGGTALVRFSGKPPAFCEVCKKKPHTKLCDALVINPYAARLKLGPVNPTCDVKLCDDCAIKSGKQDFCPRHKELA